MRFLLGKRSIIVAAGVLAAALALAASGGAVSAQTAPQPAANCRGTLTLGTVRGGIELSYTASGLEANAPYTIFVDGQAVASATTTGAGTTGGSITVPAGTHGGSAVQVTTARSCAAGTIPVVVGVLCAPTTTTVTADGVTVVINLGRTCPFGIPVRTCILPGTFIVVPC